MRFCEIDPVIGHWETVSHRRLHPAAAIPDALPLTFRSMIFLLPAALFCELVALATRTQAPSLVSGALLTLFFVARWRSLLPYPRRLGGVTLSALAAWLVLAEPSWQQGAQLLASAAYYAAFVGALGLMGCLTQRLPQLRELHRLLLAGPRHMLYPRYLLSAFTIGSVLSFGMLNLICGTLDRYLDGRGLDESQRSEGRRAVMVCALRGFALVPLLAPTSVAVAILTRELPGLTWSALLPFGLLAALVLLVAGWPAENRRLQLLRASGSEAGETGAQCFKGLVAGSLVGIGLIALLCVTTELSATQAAMLLVPPGVTLLLFRHGESARMIGREFSETLAGMRNEVFIFGCSALLAGLTAALLPIEQLAAQLDADAITVFTVGTLGALGIVLLALLGVAPIISLNISAALLAPLAAQGLPVMQPASALLIGFSLAMLLSPYGPSALLLARHAQLSPWRIAFEWNGRFVLLVLGPLLLLPLLA